LASTLFACALLMYCGSALAIGLGKMRVLSALDQPLEAEIELLSATPVELNTLTVGLGSRSDFTRAGVERSALLSMLRFETEVRDNGEAIVRLVTDDPVTEPFLHLLVAIEWAGGKLIREYTALLDPPLYAQGRPASVSSPRIAGSGAPGATVRASAAPEMPQAPTGVAAPRAEIGSVYGPIRRGETVSEIVSRLELPPGVDVFQAMVALLQRNPEAFVIGNINLIKEGSTIVLPTAEEISSISKVVASAEYSKHLNEWLAYRNRLAGAQLASSVAPAASATPLPSPTETGRTETGPAETTLTPTTGTETAGAETASGLSEDVLRIIQSENAASPGTSAAGEGEELGALKSQLAVMEESLISAELENKELRERLAMLEEQIAETNKLLRIQNSGLALAEQNAANRAAGEDDTGRAAAEEEQAAGDDVAQLRVTSSRSMLEPVSEFLAGDMLWKVLLGLAAAVLLIGILVYVRRRQSYAEFEETMMTGNTYDVRSQSSAFTQVPRMDTGQQSRQSSTRADSQQTGSLMQTSFMTEMGAPGMGTMQTDEVDPVAEADVYMAYGRDQQAMEVLQDAIRRDPTRNDFKLKLLEVYHKRKDVRAFESLAEELYPVIGKDPVRWSRVSEMGRRLSPRHPLFAGGAGGSTAGATTQTGRSVASGRLRPSVDQDSSGLDFVSAPLPGPEPAQEPGRPRGGSDHPPMGGGFESAESVGRGARGSDEGLDLDSDSLSLPVGRGLGMPSTPAQNPDDQGDVDIDFHDADDFKSSEIATKLDLAKAYLEMGDKDAARGFIEEVLKEGNDAQRRQASELAGSF
jgi:pilus assembly protein FimV